MDYAEKLDAELTPLRAEVEQTRTRYTSERAAIESDPLLSDEGRKQQISELRDTTQSSLKALRSREDRQIRDSLSMLERLAFGSPASTLSQTDLVAFRDAQDRAEQLEDETQAKQRLAIAERSRDRNLTDAIVRVAVSKGWSSVLRAHETEHPEIGTYLRGMADIQRFQRNTFARTLAYAI